LETIKLGKNEKLENLRQIVEKKENKIHFKNVEKIRTSMFYVIEFLQLCEN